MKDNSISFSAFEHIFFLIFERPDWIQEQNTFQKKGYMNFINVTTPTPNPEFYFY